LRQLVADDAEDVYRIFADDAVTKYYDLETFTDVEQALALISRQQDHFRKKVGFRWGISYKEKDLVIGTIGMIFNTEKMQGGLGYDLARPYWRQGIMYEVLQEVIRFCFETAKVERIQALVLPGNVASASLLMKLGFEEEGVLEGFAFFKNKFHDLHNFILTSGKWVVDSG
jgi:ribosomal-protein-alanine N-acetyltransferase